MFYHNLREKIRQDSARVAQETVGDRARRARGCPWRRQSTGETQAWRVRAEGENTQGVCVCCVCVRVRSHARTCMPKMLGETQVRSTEGLS